MSYFMVRFKHGWDSELQERLSEPASEEEKESLKLKAARYGKYGKAVETLVSRHKKGKELFYEVKWQDLDDEKQNTYEPFSKLREMEVEKLIKALDERLASTSGAYEKRPLSRREICKHLESFGITEEMATERLIGSFSAGQKSKLVLAGAFWQKPHMIAMDEPTNYIDMETVDALAKALKNFRGGVMVVTHSQAFVDEVCTELWEVKDGCLTAKPLGESKK
jgi:ATPase subunit of ABC transporter with duplicated ATPase domains